MVVANDILMIPSAHEKFHSNYHLFGIKWPLKLKIERKKMKCNDFFSKYFRYLICYY